MTGVNIRYNFLSNEVERKVHYKNKLLGVWYNKIDTNEDNEMYENVFSIGGGVDFFYSDKPLEAKKVRD